MSESRSALLLRYRPILYLFTGVAAAYIAVYVHNHFILTSSRGPSLRRRNAIRRHRRSESEQSDIVDTPSFRAISHLEQLERQNGVYGTFRIETDDGRRVESGLLPSLLATRDQLMEEVGVPEAHAERMRETMEDTFLESFLALDFPPSHVIPEESVEREFLIEQLQMRGISRAGIERALTHFNGDSNYGDQLRHRRQNGERVTLSTPSFPEASVPLQNLDGGDTIMDDQSVFSWRDGNNDSSPAREGQNLLNLLYHIAEDQARRDGYIHRGVTCNSCGAMPIQGIRYRCANCIDYDLCETCEAMQVHIKTHLFYKVRIPAPFLGNPRQSQPVWYPGKPSMLPRSLPRPLAKRLMKETNFENTELDALWDQFRCLANYEWPDDPNKLNMAIDRKTFDRLIYDRMFAFYDTNGDGLIGFEEFLKGLASLNNKSNDERLRRVFRGYDIDGDGYVDRKDFLRVFRAYYALSRELTRDMVAGMEDDFLEGGARDVILRSQPISSAFPGSIPPGEPSRVGEGKQISRRGDLEIADNEGVLRQDSDDTGDRHIVVGNAAMREQFGRTRPMFPPSVRIPDEERIPRSSRVDGTRDGEEDEEEEEGSSDGDASSSSLASAYWPPAEHVLEEDIVNALGGYVSLQEVTDPVDRARIGTAVYHRMRDDDLRRMGQARRHGIDERWRRRIFYTDEEDGSRIPDGYERDPDVDVSSDEGAAGGQQAAESHPPSLRSRSSSKVRFQDDLTDDYDVRSSPSTLSHSIPVGERWGGFEIPDVEKDVGKEILYQYTQQGLNELLDILFKPKEDLLMEVYRTRAERETWASEIEAAWRIDSLKETENGQAANEREDGYGMCRTDVGNRSLEELLKRTGYSVAGDALEGAETGPVLAPPSPDPEVPNDDLQPVRSLGREEDHIDLTLPQNRPSREYDDAFRPSRGYGMLHRDVSRDTTLFDPTLPQHRPTDEQYHEYHPTQFIAPNDINIPNRQSGQEQALPLPLRPSGTATFPVPAPPSSALPEAEATAPKAPISPAHSLPPQDSVSSRRTERYGLYSPSRQTLLRWAYLNQVEAEAKRRGGHGAKLNFEEFAKRMTADRGRRLAFVASWIEMASF